MADDFRRPGYLYYIDGFPAWKVFVQDPAEFAGVDSAIRFRAFCLPEGAILSCLYWMYDIPEQPYYMHRAFDVSNHDVAVYLERTRRMMQWIVEVEGGEAGTPARCVRIARMEDSGFLEAFEAALSYNDSLGDGLDGTAALDRFLDVFSAPAQARGPEAAWQEVENACAREQAPEPSPGSRLAASLAGEEAKKAGFGEVRAEHYWIALCKLTDLAGGEIPARLIEDPDGREALGREVEALRLWFQTCGIDPVSCRRAVRKRLGQPTLPTEPEAERAPTPECREILRRAARGADMERAGAVLLVHLARALLDSPPPILSEILGKAGHLFPSDRHRAQEAPPKTAVGGLLGTLGRNITQMAREGRLGRVIGRKEEVRRLGQVLTQKRKPNAILVGDAGVGKTCLVEGLAQKIASTSCPPAFRDKEIIEIPTSAIVAGTRYRGEFEQKMEALVRQAEEDERVILFVDEIHTLLGAGTAEGAPLDAANILKPALARGRLRLIGATTGEEYQRYIARDPAFSRRLDVVWVEEPSRPDAMEILKGLREGFEKHHGLSISDEALDAAVDLSMRYLPERRLPDKALDLIDQACARTALRSFSHRSPDAESKAGGTVDRDAVARVVAARCRVPLEILLMTEAERLESLEAALSDRVVGQEEAVGAVASAVRTAMAGLKDPRRPIASFLFVGPSGVGKTELAKALSESLFASDQRLIRLDMSECMEPHAVARLIGAPPGYVGHAREGQLTGPIRQSPFAVLLFDEIEKAHPDVLNLLLQLLDEGRLTDGQGRTADFRETVVVLSSNLGTGVKAGSEPLMGFGAQKREGAGESAVVREAVDGFLRPELRNRLTQVVLFKPLDVPALEKVVEMAVRRVGRRLEGRGVRIELDAEARSLLARRGHDPRFGAREIERLVEREITKPIAEALLKGKVGGTVKVSVRDGKIAVEI